MLKWNNGRIVFVCLVGILDEAICTKNEGDGILIFNREEYMPLNCELELFFIKTCDLINFETDGEIVFGGKVEEG